MNNCNASGSLLMGLHSWPLNKYGLLTQRFFELRRSTHTDFFFPINTYCFSTCGWELTDAGGQLYAFFFAILYRKLEQLQILVGEQSPGINLPGILRGNLNSRELKRYRQSP